MFEEDPLDRCCRLIYEWCLDCTLWMGLIIRYDWYRFIYIVRIAMIQGNYRLVCTWLKVHSWCYAFYRRSICTPLMLYGLMHVPTWSEVESRRLKMIARSGLDIPRPSRLEEGLRQEQSEHLS